MGRRQGRGRRIPPVYVRGSWPITGGVGYFRDPKATFVGSGTVTYGTTGTGAFTAKVPTLAGTGIVFSVNIIGTGDFVSPKVILVAVGVIEVQEVLPIPLPSPPKVDKYQVVIATLAGVALEEVPAKNLQFTYTLNGSGAVDFTLPTLHAKSTPELLEVGSREIQVYRNGTRVWGGYLWFIGVEVNNLRCNGNGYFSILSHRLIDVDKSYIGWDQFDIVRDLITFTQSKANGGLGITFGTTGDSGVGRTFYYWAFQRPNLGEAIEHFTEIEDGFDFNLAPDKKWYMYYPRRGTDTDIIFELGKNVYGISIERDAEDIANEVTAVGAGEGQDTLLSVVSDSASRTVYGLHQLALSQKDTTESSVLAGSATEALRIAKQPRWRPQISVSPDDPPFGTYNVGDRVRLRAQHGYIDLDDVFRINQINVAVSNEGRDAITLFFEREEVEE